MTDSALATTPDHFPDQALTFALSGPSGQLEASADVPAKMPGRQGTAIICHPLPLEGGTMHNKVVTMLERALREAGLATVRFNFRGVGASQGEFDDGRGEAEDLAAVAAWVRKVRPDDDLWLAGFSFGSYVALASAASLQAAALITVAPPVGRSYDFDAITLPECPWLVIQGEEDEIVDPDAVFAWLDGLNRPATVIRMPETSHFFHRRLLDLRGAVKNATSSWLPAERTI